MAIVNYLKFAVFFWATLMGFFATYAFAWIAIGLPIAWWAAILLLILSVLSEWGFLKWLMD